jgi:hypothetical protein
MMRQEFIDKFEDLVKDQIQENVNSFIKVYKQIDKCNERSDDLENLIKLHRLRTENQIKDVQDSVINSSLENIRNLENHKKSVNKNIKFIEEYKNKIENEINSKLYVDEFEDYMQDLKVEILEKFSFDKGRMDGLSSRIEKNKNLIEKLEEDNTKELQLYNQNLEQRCEKNEKDIKLSKVDFDEVDKVIQRFEKKIFIMEKHIEYLINRLKRLEDKGV